MNYVSKDLSKIKMQPFAYTSFFEGPVHAWGVFVDRFGAVRSNLTVRMNGAWRGDTFVLDEEFVFDNGVPDQRTWLIKNLPDGRFTATCDQCIGLIEGQNQHDGARISYRFKISVKGVPVSVTFDDQVYRIDDRRLFNRATMKKFGVTLGHCLLVAERQL